MTKPLNTVSKASAIKGLNDRSREVLKHIVDAYVETGAPVDSRTLSRSLGLGLSPPTVPIVMRAPENLALRFGPPPSPGPLPPALALRPSVAALLEIGTLTPADRARIATQMAAPGPPMAGVREEEMGR